MTGETIPSELPSNFAYTIKQPLGVVACVTPGIFQWPFQFGKLRQPWLQAIQLSLSPPR